MKKKLFILGLLIPMFVIGCSTSDDSFDSEPDSTPSESEPSTDTDGTVAVKSVKLDKTSLYLYPDDDPVTLKATVLPEDATNKKVTWSSNDTSVATVSSGGKVTPKNPGTANITVKTVDGKKSATCKVNVSVFDYVLHGKYGYDSKWTDKAMIYNELSEAEYMLLSVQLYENDVFKIHMYGDTWYGASDLKDTVDSSIVGPAPSDDNIKVLVTGVYDVYSSYNESYGGHVYIKPSDYTPSPGTVFVDDIMLSRSGKYLQYRNEFTLTANIYPNHASNKTVIWTSSDESIATVTSGGRVVAKEKTGTTVITGTTYDQEKTDTCVVYVNPSEVPPYYLTGRIGGRSISPGTYTYAAIPLGGNEYLIPNVNLVSGDSVKVMLKNGSYVHSNSIGYPTYEYTTTTNKSVNMYLTIESSSGGYTFGSLSAVNRASRDIYVKYNANTNSDGKCAWVFVEGYDINPQWIKSTSLSSGSTGCRFNIPKHAEQITVVRAPSNQNPDNYYSSLTNKTLLNQFDLYDDVYEYDARV